MYNQKPQKKIFCKIKKKKQKQKQKQKQNQF